MATADATRFLRSVAVDWDSVEDREAHPFDLELVRSLGRLSLDAPVTYFVGENGSGKSTLLEAIAVAVGFNAEGGSKSFSHSTRASHSSLCEHLEIRKGQIPRDGFFLRAESYFNLATTIEQLDKEPFGGRRIIDSYGGQSLHEQSHGESFFALFLNRFSGDGLYILDEPEAALSPARQMALITRIHDLVSNRSQFLIATHSPIVLAYPGATIYQLSESGIDTVEYRDSEPYVVMKQFLDRPEAMVDILTSDE